MLEIIPIQLTQDQRDLLADRLDGIDVCELGFKNGHPQKVYGDQLEDDIPEGSRQRPKKLMAFRPDFKGLMEAVLENEVWIRNRGRSWIDASPEKNFALKKHVAIKGDSLARVALAETDYGAPDKKEIERILREPVVK